MATSYCWWFITPHVDALCMSREAWAAWVQAIFSVIAILASAAFVHWQHRLERLRDTEYERRQKLEFLGAVLAIVKQTQFYFDAAIELAAKEHGESTFAPKAGHWIIRLTHATDQLNEIPLFKIDSTRLPAAICLIKHHVQELIKSQEFTPSQITVVMYRPYEINVDYARTMANEIATAIKNIEEEIINAT